MKKMKTSCRKAAESDGMGDIEYITLVMTTASAERFTDCDRDK